MKVNGRGLNNEVIDLKSIHISQGNNTINPMKKNNKSKKRNKSGKITGWSCHVKAVCHKEETNEQFIERAEIRVSNEPSLERAKNSRDVAKALSNWLFSIVAENDYKKSPILSVERWTEIRG